MNGPAPRPPGPDGAQVVRVRGEEIRLLPEGALFWPAERALVVADFHLGKAATFGMHGMPLPEAAQSEDLTRLTAAGRREGARALVLLGDLVHTLRGLTSELRRAFLDATSEFAEIRLVAGNHDRGLVRAWPADWVRIEVVDRWSRGPFRFQHEPPASPPSAADPYVWAGHVHPCIRLAGGADRLRLRTFVLRDDYGLLPAFSGLAGGFDLRADRRTRFYPLANGKVYAPGSWT